MTNERKLSIFYVIRVVEPIFADRYHQGPSIRYPDLFCRGDLLRRQYFLLAYKPIFNLRRRHLASAYHTGVICNLFASATNP